MPTSTQPWLTEEQAEGFNLANHLICHNLVYGTNPFDILDAYTIDADHPLFRHLPHIDELHDHLDSILTCDENILFVNKALCSLTLGLN